MVRARTQEGDHPGHLYGKAGTDVEWALFHEHWDAGEPTLLTGLTMSIRHGDLLVDKGSGVLMIIEAKKNLAKAKGPQKRRVAQLVEMLSKEARYEGPEGPSWIVESAVKLRTHWADAVPALEEAAREGVSAWVARPGLGVLFLAPIALSERGREEGQRALEGAQEALANRVGQLTQNDHRILIHSAIWPYRAGPVAPLSILPIPTQLSARLVTGDIVFSIPDVAARQPDPTFSEHAVDRRRSRRSK